MSTKVVVAVVGMISLVLGLAARSDGAIARGSYPGQLGAVSQYVSAVGIALPADQVVVNSGTARILAIVPWNADASTPQVWRLHAFTGNFATITSAGDRSMIDSWVGQGWVVLSIDATADLTKQSQIQSREQEWGNEAIRQAAVDAFAWARSLWPSAPGPLVYGASMGGLSAVNIAYEFGQRGLPITAIALNSPAANLRSDWHIVRARASIRMNYGLSSGAAPGNAEWISKIDDANGGHDGAVRGVVGIATSIPFRIYVGTKDTATPPRVNGSLFDAELTAAGWPSEHHVLSYPTTHLGAATYQPGDVIAFFQRALIAAGS